MPAGSQKAFGSCEIVAHVTEHDKAIVQRHNMLQTIVGMMNGNIPAQIVDGRVVARNKILCLLLGMMAVVTGNDLQGDRRKWRDLVESPDFTSGSETLFPKELFPEGADCFNQHHPRCASVAFLCAVLAPPARDLLTLSVSAVCCPSQLQASACWDASQWRCNCLFRTSGDSDPAVVQMSRGYARNNAYHREADELRLDKQVRDMDVPEMEEHFIAKHARVLATGGTGASKIRVRGFRISPALIITALCHSSQNHRLMNACMPVESWALSTGCLIRRLSLQALLLQKGLAMTDKEAAWKARQKRRVADRAIWDAQERWQRQFAVPAGGAATSCLC